MDIPNVKTGQRRVVIIGGGFAGIRLAKQLSPKHFQVILLDKNNYHQFQPLLYQVATCGLEPSSIIVFRFGKYSEGENVSISALQKHWEWVPKKTSLPPALAILPMTISYWRRGQQQITLTTSSSVRILIP